MAENFDETKRVDEDCDVEEGKAIPKKNLIEKAKDFKADHPAIVAGVKLTLMGVGLLIVYGLGKKSAVDKQIFENDPSKNAEPDSTVSDDTTESTEEENTLVSYNTDEN